MLKKLKYFLEDDSIYTFLIVSLLIIIAFGAGRVSALEITHFSFFDVTTDTESQVALTLTKESGVVDDSPFISHPDQITGDTVAASRNGTRYYYLHCSGIARINEENLLFFKSSQHAQFSGYLRAANCN